MPRELKPLDELSRSGRKYRTDKKYADKMRDHSRKILTERRTERLSEIRNFDDERKGVNLWKPRLFHGKEVVNTTAFCDYTGIARMTVWNWRQAGSIPNPTMTDSMGRGWYSWDYIDAMRRVLKTRLRSNLQDFRAQVIEEFAKAGICDPDGNNIETAEPVAQE